MTSYRVRERATLVLRVDDGPWQTFDACVLVTAATAESTVLEVDPVASTAATALGPGAGGTVTARGHGPGFAMPTSRNSGPYALPPTASMTVHVDGRSRKISFDEQELWTADDVAARINRQLRRSVARGTAADGPPACPVAQGTVRMSPERDS